MATSSSPDETQNPYRAPTAGPIDEVEVEAGDDLDAGGTWLSHVGFWLYYTLAFWIPWSFFMSLNMGWSFTSILLGPGLAAGLMFGTVMTAVMAVVMRRKAVTVSFHDRKAFLEALGAEARKIRYRPRQPSGDRLVFAPNTPIRPRMYFITVRVGPSSATIVGPATNIKNLKKRLERTSV